MDFRFHLFIYFLFNMEAKRYLYRHLSLLTLAEEFEAGVDPFLRTQMKFKCSFVVSLLVLSLSYHASSCFKKSASPTLCG